MITWARVTRWLRDRRVVALLHPSTRDEPPAGPLPPPEGSRLLREAMDDLASSQADLQAAIRRPPGVVPVSRNAIANVIAHRGDPS